MCKLLKVMGYLLAIICMLFILIVLLIGMTISILGGNYPGDYETTGRMIVSCIMYLVIFGGYCLYKSDCEGYK